MKLDTNGFVRVVGVNNNSQDLALSNGAGKSSIFDAITWALTGETIRGITNNVVNKNTTGGTMVSLDFECDGSFYSITRTREHSVYKSNLFLKVNGEDKSGKGLRETEKILSDYLPDISMGLIGSVIVLGQGLPQRFTNNTPSGRKEVLEKLSKSDFMIEDLKTRISARKEELNAKQRECEDAVLKLQTEIDILNQSIKDREQRLIDMGTADSLLMEKKTIEKSIEEMSKQKDYLDSIIEDMDRKLNDLRAEYTELISKSNEEKTEKTKKLWEEYNEMASSAHMLQINVNWEKEQIDKFRNTSDVCPTCGQKIVGIGKLREEQKRSEERLSDYTKKLSDATEKQSRLKNLIEAEELSISNKYDDNRKKLTDEGTEMSKELIKKKSDSISLRNKLEIVRDDLLKVIAKINNFDNIHKSISEEIEKNKQQIVEKEDKLGYSKIEGENIKTRISFISQLWTCVTRDFRGHLLKNVIEYMSKKAREFSEKMFNGSCVDICIDGNAVSISYDGREYESLSGGEKQKVDIIVQFAIRDMLCKFLNFECNILVVDEVFDNLDEVGCGHVINLINGLNNVSCVYVITHHGSELSIPYDSEIIVTKKSNGVSEVIQH